MRLTKIYGAADVLQQAGQLGGFQVGECCLILGDPLVKVSQFALNGLLHCPLPRLQLGVFRVPVMTDGCVSFQNVVLCIVVYCYEPPAWLLPTHEDRKSGTEKQLKQLHLTEKLTSGVRLSETKQSKLFIILFS